MYNIGLYAGAFNPLHLGHLSCIVQGANICKTLYVVVSSNKKRDVVDVQTKCHWIRRSAEKIKNIRLIVLPDDCDRKSDYTIEAAINDVAFVKEQIGEPIDVVFFGDDYGEGSLWYICYPESKKHIFPRNEISSSELRKDIRKHWEWLPEVVKEYYVSLN